MTRLRAALLEKLGWADAELCAEVERLLAQGEAAKRDPFMAIPASTDQDGVRPARSTEEKAEHYWSQSLEGPSTVTGFPAATTPLGLAEHPDYEVIRELGQGGMGTVYLAQNR